MFYLTPIKMQGTALVMIISPSNFSVYIFCNYIVIIYGNLRLPTVEGRNHGS